LPVRAGTRPAPTISRRPRTRALAHSRTPSPHLLPHAPPPGTFPGCVPRAAWPVTRSSRCALLMTTSISAEVRVPGDKSLTHRALMFAAAARGESRLSGLLAGADCRSTAEVLRALGVDIPELPSDGSEIRVHS